MEPKTVQRFKCYNHANVLKPGEYLHFTVDQDWSEQPGFEYRARIEGKESLPCEVCFDGLWLIIIVTNNRRKRVAIPREAIVIVEMIPTTKGKITIARCFEWLRKQAPLRKIS